MKCYIYTHDGSRRVRVEEHTPVCGEDFCDTCGDCLSCYGGDPCYDGLHERDEHFWVVYLDENGELPEDWRNLHS